MTDSDVPVLQVDGLVKHFPVSRGLIRRKVIGMVRAVEGVSFEIARGETLRLDGKPVGVSVVHHKAQPGEGVTIPPGCGELDS